MAVPVSMPYVKVVKSATPRVDVRPGMAPNIIPKMTEPKRMAIWSGSDAI